MAKTDIGCKIIVGTNGQLGISGQCSLANFGLEAGVAAGKVGMGTGCQINMKNKNAIGLSGKCNVADFGLQLSGKIGKVAT